jgi:hypothetical protein
VQVEVRFRKKPFFNPYSIAYCRTKNSFCRINCTLLKESPLKMSEFLRNKCFFEGKSPKNVWHPKNKLFFNKSSLSYWLIPEKDCLNFCKIRTLLKENLLVLPEFLRNKFFVKGKSLKNVWIPLLVYEDFLFKPNKFEFT